MERIIKNIILKILRFYQIFISTFTRPSCRFYPTCSEYAYQAFENYGVFRGSFLTIKRILKCHPFHPGGYDPLP